MKGRYLGYVDGHDPLHDFLGRIVRDHFGLREVRPAFRVFRLTGSNEVYGYEEKSSRTKVICKFYGPRFGPDRDRATSMARQEYEGLETLRRYDLVGSPHHVIRPLAFDGKINGVLAVEYYAGEEFSHAIARATLHGDDDPPVLAAQGPRLVPGHPAQPDREWGDCRLRRRLPLLRHRRRPAGQDRSDRAVGCRRAVVAA